MGPKSIPKQDIWAGDRRFEQKDCRIQSELNRTSYQEELKMSHIGRNKSRKTVDKNWMLRW